MGGRCQHVFLKALLLLFACLATVDGAALHHLDSFKGSSHGAASANAREDTRQQQEQEEQEEQEQQEQQQQQLRQKIKARRRERRSQQQHRHSLRSSKEEGSGRKGEDDEEEEVSEGNGEGDDGDEDEAEEKKPKRVDIREIDPDLQATVKLSPLEEKEKKEDKMQKKRERIAALLWLEGRLREMHRELDEPVFEKSIEEEERSANGEVGMPEMVNTLSEMRKEMHRYAAPVYQKVVDEALMQVAGKRMSLLEEMQDKTQAEPIPEHLLSEEQKQKEGGKLGQAILASSAILVIAALLVMHRAAAPS